ncbi:MAG: phosphoribosyltransferase family protein [Desulforhopalus sp.]
MQEKLIDTPQFRNRHGVFVDRKDAGQHLASMMESFRERSKTIILAIPSGGVPVGLELSRNLALPMDLVITRKIQIPGNTEAGFGAMTMTGKAFINRELLDMLRLSEAEVDKQMEKVRLELDRRNSRFRNNKPFPKLEGLLVIMVDDGLASGFTMLAAIDMAKSQGAKKIIVAVPTSPLSSIVRIQDKVDQNFCANVQDSGSFAVASAYRNWRDIEPDEVVEMLSGAGLLD